IDGLPDRISPVEGPPIPDLDVLEDLRELFHWDGRSERFFPQRAHGKQRGGDAVAGWPELLPDDVARLLAPKGPAATLHLPGHVLAAPWRGRPVDPGLGHPLMKAVVAHDRPRNAAVEAILRREVPGAEGDQLVPVADPAIAVHRDHAVAVAV